MVYISALLKLKKKLFLIMSVQSRRHGRNAATAGLAKKNPEEIPLLRFGNNNNFHKFREALSKAALREYGHGWH
jgi:hypothetical protein